MENRVPACPRMLLIKFNDHRLIVCSTNWVMHEVSVPSMLFRTKVLKANRNQVDMWQLQCEKPPLNVSREHLVNVSFSALGNVYISAWHSRSRNVEFCSSLNCISSRGNFLLIFKVRFPFFFSRSTITKFFESPFGRSSRFDSNKRTGRPHGFPLWLQGEFNNFFKWNIRKTRQCQDKHKKLQVLRSGHADQMQCNPILLWKATRWKHKTYKQRNWRVIFHFNIILAKDSGQQHKRSRETNCPSSTFPISLKLLLLDDILSVLLGDTQAAKPLEKIKHCENTSLVLAPCANLWQRN